MEEHVTVLCELRVFLGKFVTGLLGVRLEGCLVASDLPCWFRELSFGVFGIDFI